MDAQQSEIAASQAFIWEGWKNGAKQPPVPGVPVLAYAYSPRGDPFLSVMQWVAHAAQWRSPGEGLVVYWSTHSKVPAPWWTPIPPLPEAPPPAPVQQTLLHA
jgi:hypothetical protein